MSFCELINLAKNGDQSAKSQLVEENVGLVWSVVKRFIGKGVDPEDLYQLGCLGLLKAIDGFDFTYGTQFSTYAVPKISGEIRRFLRDDGAVKVSRSMKERSAAIKAMRERLSGILCREPYVSELAEYSGFTVEEIAEAETATAYVESLQKENGSEGYSLECLLSDSYTEERMIEEISLHDAVQALPEKEQMVIKLRYYRGLTQDKTAQIMKVSQVQISRIEKKALARMRDIFDDK